MTESPTNGNIWRKSTYSGSDSQCVEVAGNPDGTLLVRDSKAPDGGILRFGGREWAAFVTGVRGGAG